MQNGSTITSIELYKLFIPLKEPFVISLGPIMNVQNVVVIIRTQDLLPSLDSTPEPGSSTPDLDDAAWLPADTPYSDSGDGHTDNYEDPSSAESTP